MHRCHAFAYHWHPWMFARLINFYFLRIWWRTHSGFAFLSISLDCYLSWHANPNYCLWTNTHPTHLFNNITRIEILPHYTGQYIKLSVVVLKPWNNSTIIKFSVFLFHNFHWYSGPYQYILRCFIIICRKVSKLRDSVVKSLDYMQIMGFRHI